MPSANRTAYLITTVRDMFATDATLDVVKVWQEKAYPSEPMVYPFIQSTTFLETMENGRVEHGLTTFGVFVNVAVTGETLTPTGKGTDKYAEVIGKCEACINSTVLPKTETHTDTTKTTITSIAMATQNGFFDMKDNKVNIDFTITVHWTAAT